MPRKPLDLAKNAISPPPHNFQKKLPNAATASPKNRRSHALDNDSRRASWPSAIAVNDVERLIADYLLDCDYRLMSPSTLETRRCFFRNFVWFLRHREYADCDTPELRQFLHYLRHGHEEPGGRWGNPNYKKTLRPATIRDYYVALRCFFNWLVAGGELGVSPLDAIPKPPLPTEQVQPFSNEQIQALLKAARRSTQPRRNEAIVLFLYDTGVRATELCQLTMADIDMENRHARVLGKGNKSRTVYFSRETARVLSVYLRQRPREPEHPVFLSRIGKGCPPMTRSALLRIISSLGRAAGIKAMKVSPHVFRHSAAIQLLRNGCDVYSLMSLLGHSSLAICQTYLKLSQADLENQHRRFSPVESLGNRRKR